jgi:hypothetical protein
MFSEYSVHGPMLREELWALARGIAFSKSIRPPIVQRRWSRSFLKPFDIDVRNSRSLWQLSPDPMNRF